MPDFRGGGGAVQQLAQLGGVGQQAQPQVPGLLQMAQAAMDGGGGFSGGSPVPFGAEVRPITSPEDQNWSDAQGNPIHVGGPAPAYNPGTTAGGYNAVFDPRAPSAQGGWFTMQDYLRDNPENTRHGSPYGTNALSTNNWRLLGNDPDLFMINGNVVNRRVAQRELSPRSVLGQEAGGVHPGYRSMGGGIWAMPTGSYAWDEGYIGSGGWGQHSTPTY